MRRMLLLLAVAAMILALTAGPVLAQRDTTDLPPPGEDTPGDPKSPDANPDNFPEDPTSDQGPAQNFIGEDQRGSAAGPGTPNPGSAAKPTTFNGEPAFNGPVTSTIGTLPAGPVEEGGSGIFPESTKPNVISAFQEDKRCSLLGPASCPEA